MDYSTVKVQLVIAICGLLSLAIVFKNMGGTMRSVETTNGSIPR